MNRRYDFNAGGWESDSETQMTRAAAEFVATVLHPSLIDEPEEKQPVASLAALTAELPEVFRDPWKRDVALAAVTCERPLSAVAADYDRTRAAASKTLRELAKMFPTLRRPRGQFLDSYRDGAARGWETRRKRRALAAARANEGTSLAAQPSRESQPEGVTE